MRTWLVAVAGAVLLAFLCAGQAFAETVTVCPATGNETTDCDFRTVQAALDGVASGDTIHIDFVGEIREMGIVIEKSVTISGNGPGETFIQGIENDCDASNRVFLNQGDRVTIRDLTIRYGCVDNGNDERSSGEGGGIWNSGELALERVVVRDNRVTAPNGRGGGIYNIGRLTLSQTAIIENEATGSGGGIYNGGFIAGMSNVTISNNRVGEIGGGIYNDGFVAARYTTIFDNHGASRSDIYNATAAFFFAGQSVIENCQGADLVTTGRSISPELRPGSNPEAPEGMCGLEYAPPPVLKPLDKGAAIPFHLPEQNGPAFDAVECENLAATFDMRGSPRRQGSACDLGAVELPMQFLAFAEYPIPYPDLLIREFSVGPAESIQAGEPVTLSLVINNQGLRGLTRDESYFWLDLYVNPMNEPPNEAGKTWRQTCPPPPDRAGSEVAGAPCFGLGWQVTRPLQSGETVTVTSSYTGDTRIAILNPHHTDWDGFFPSAGSYEIWAYIDTWGEEPTEHGWVPESNEDNNRIGPINVIVQPGVQSVLREDEADDPKEIPPRPIPDPK